MFNASSKVRSLITPLSPSPPYLNTWGQICPWNRTNLISMLCKLGRYPDSNLCKGDFLMVQWSRCRASTAGGTGLIPSQGIKIPYASWLNPNKKQSPWTCKELRRESWSGDARLHHRYKSTDESCKGRWDRLGEMHRMRRGQGKQHFSAWSVHINPLGILCKYWFWFRRPGRRPTSLNFHHGPEDGDATVS